MTDDKRQGERVPVGLRVRLRFADLDAFVAGYAANISRNGVFLERVAPRPIDTLVRFEIVLADNSVALRGEGRVLWSRAEGDRAGIAVRFTRLDTKSKALVDELVANARTGRVSMPPPGPRVPHAIAPAGATRAAAPPPSPSPASAAAPAAPRAQTDAPRVAGERRSVEDIARELDELARESEPHLAARRASQPTGERRSVAELADELERLGGEVGAAAAPARPPSPARRPDGPPPPPPAAFAPRGPPPPPEAAFRASVPRPYTRPPPPAPRRVPSAAPPRAPEDYADLPPVLGVLDEDGAVRNPAAPARDAATQSSEASAAVAPAPMREPTPVPEPPDADETFETESVDVPLPQPPPMPRPDVARGLSSPRSEDELPDIDLGEMSEPSRGATDDAHATGEAGGGAATSSTAPKPGRTLLQKLLNR